MKEFKGTPGPWFWEGGVLCNKDFIIGGNGGHSFHNKANKDLIASAPELLEALRDLEARACIYVNTSEAKAAIAKALGEIQ